MSVATIIGGIGSLVGGGFGIGKIFSVFKKFRKGKKIFKKANDVRREGMEAFDAAKECLAYMEKAWGDKSISPAEIKKGGELIADAKRELDEAKVQWDEFRAIFK